MSIYGIGEAAHRYFGKPLDALSIEEIALVAGLIKGPNTYSPAKNLEQATQRRNVVLRRLRDEGIVTEEAWKEASAMTRSMAAAAAIPPSLVEKWRCTLRAGTPPRSH